MILEGTHTYMQDAHKQIARAGKARATNTARFHQQIGDAPMHAACPFMHAEAG